MKRFRPLINADECKGCSRCVVACQKDVFKMGTKINAQGLPFVEIINPDVCNGCSACFYTCPEPGAVSIVFTESIL